MVEVPDLAARREDSTIELREPRLKLIGLLLTGLLFTVGGAFMAREPGHPENATIGLLVSVFFGLCTLVFLWRLIASRQPSAILTAQGLLRPGSFDGLLPWTAVQSCTFYAYGSTRGLQLALYPGGADHLRWKGPQAALLSLRGKTAPAKIGIQLMGSQAESDAFARAVVERLDAATEQRRDNPEWDRIDASRAEAAEAAYLHAAQSEATAVFPFATFGLIALLAAVFVAEVMASHAGEPSIQTLVRFGGVFRLAVAQGEWTRLFSAPFLHAGVAHLILNCVALWLAGRQLERYIGAGWFAAVFAAGGLAGSLMSLALNPPNLVSVGASGGIVGLFAATALASRHFPPGRMRELMVLTSVQTLVPALLPLASLPGGGKIDYAGHFGGALGGLALGAALLALWPQEAIRPRLGRPAAAGAAAFVLIGVGAVVVSAMRG